MAKRYYVLPRSYTTQEIREFEKQYVILSPMNLSPFEECPPIEDVIRDLNIGFQEHLNAVGSYIEIEKKK